MSDTTLTLVPWAPGTSVGAYPRRSEQLRPDGPPTGIPPVDTQIVTGDASLTYDLADGEYWAAAPLNGSDLWQYVAFVAELPFDEEGHALAASQSPNGNWHEVMVDDTGRLSTVDLGPSQPPHGPPPYATLGDLELSHEDIDARLDTVEDNVSVAPGWGVERLLNDRAIDRVSLLDNFSAAERSDARGYIGSIDTTAKAQSIVDYFYGRGQPAVITVPHGRYKWNNLKQRNGISIVAEGYVPGISSGLFVARTKAVQIVGSDPGWAITTAGGAGADDGSYVYGAMLAGLHFQGPGAASTPSGIRRGAIHHLRTRYCGVVACSGIFFDEWGILQEFGWGNAYFDNAFIHCLLDRTRAIDKTTLPHGAIETRGFNNYFRGGEYGATVGTPGNEQGQVFGAATVTGTFGPGGSGGVADLGASASSVDDAYNGYLVEVTSGTFATALGYIDDYAGATKLATLNGNVPFSGMALSGETYKLTPMRCVAGAFKGGDSYVAGGMYEISEAGIWVGTSGDAHHFDGVTSDLNAGPGWLLAGEALLTGCKAHRASKAGHGLYDGYVAVWEKAGVISGCSSGGNFGDAVYERNGFFSGYFGTNPATNWKVANFAHRGLRTGQRIKRLPGVGQDADGTFAAPAANVPAISIWQEGQSLAAWQMRPDVALRNGAGDVVLYRLASGIWGFTGGVALGSYIAEAAASQTLAANGAVSINPTTAGVHRVTLQANATSVAISNGAVNGQRLTVEFIQDATGTRTVVWPTSNVVYAGGAAPVTTTTANRRDIVVFQWNNTTIKWQEISRSLAVG
jgi:hypothetical protein